jgi:hypothetical protein|tara:strand:+ start:72 stop:215 length:144 start_codon:yes stop_codon:yes gene_type:complete
MIFIALWATPHTFDIKRWAHQLNSQRIADIEQGFASTKSGTASNKSV